MSKSAVTAARRAAKLAAKSGTVSPDVANNAGIAPAPTALETLLGKLVSKLDDVSTRLTALEGDDDSEPAPVNTRLDAKQVRESRKAAAVDVDDSAVDHGSDLTGPNGEKYPVGKMVEVANPKPGEAKSKFKAFPVRPADRKLFMEVAKRTFFGAILTADDGSPNGATLTATGKGKLEGKAYSSGDHGVYGRQEFMLELPTGEVFTLEGQVTLMLKARNDNGRVGVPAKRSK